MDQRYTALQVLEHPWVTVGVSLAEQLLPATALFPMKHFLLFCSTQNEGLCENEHQLSVAGKIKKHFNTNPKVNDTTADVSVISVSYHEKRHFS